MSENDIGREVLQKALSRLLAGQEVSLISKGDASGGPDSARSYLLQWGSKRTPLEVLWTGTGWPSEVRTALERIRGRWPRRLVAVARRFSPGALELLRERDANWVDAAGHIRLLVPTALFAVSEGARPKEAAKPTPSPEMTWSRSKLDIAEVLLTKPGARITVADLAAESGWSKPQVSVALGQLDRLGWTTRHGPRRGPNVYRELAQPGVLLDAWTEYRARHRPRRVLGHRLLRDAMTVLREEIAPVLRRRRGWAVTGWAGLELTTPHLTVVPTLQIYLAPDLFARAGELQRDCKVSPVEDGANVEFWETRLLLAHERDAAIPVIDLPRLYADLMALGGRASEGAEHLRGTLLGF